MTFNIGFYVHHHGSGHLMRTLQVIDKLKNYHITLFGSALQHLSGLGDNVDLVHLPLDIPESDDSPLLQQNQLSMLHYAPLAVRGIGERTAILTNVFEALFPLILVVDVSVEITMLARLSGIPTIVIKQHGKRMDVAHLNAYESAEKLIAPYSSDMHQGAEDWVFDKTVFAGGFSRFDGRKPLSSTVENKVAILLGAGGTCLDSEFVDHIAKHCQDFEFHVFGSINHNHEQQENVVYHQHCADPFEELSSSHIVIGNLGHNTVMEVASLNKRFIGIPESRPFFEQVEKALSIKDRSGIKILMPEEIYTREWREHLTGLSASKIDWRGVIVEKAIDNFAEAILHTASALFGSKSF